MTFLRKAFVVSVMFSTILSLSMIAAPQVSAASAGDLIKMDGLSSVYYLGSDSKRYVFPNEKTYFSWYSDFSSVVTVSQSELESYPLGANVTMRPGTKLVKITTDPKVYAVTPGGNLVWVPSEAVATSLYGANWAQRVVDVPDAFFTNYTVTGTELTADEYPAGSLVKMADASDVYYIDEDGMARKITTEAAFNDNRFMWDNVLTAPEGYTLPTMGADLSAKDADLTDTSEGAGGTAGAGTGLTAALSSATPASMTVPDTSIVDVFDFKLTAAADGAVTVNSVTVSLFGLGNYGDVTDVTLYNDGVRISNPKNMNNDRAILINITGGGLEIPAGTSKTISVKAKIGGSDFYALGVAEAGDILTNGAVVSGTFPIKGNQMTGSSVTVGTVDLASWDGTDESNVELGEDDVVLADFSLEIGSAENVLWDTATFKNKDDEGVASNFRIEIDSEEIAEGTEDGDYVMFDMGNFLLEEDETYDVQVLGDIGVADESDTYELVVDELSDFVFIGQEFGFDIEMTATPTDYDSNGIEIGLTGGDVSLNIDKTASVQNKEVRSDTKNVVLAVVEIKSVGEDATIEEIDGTSSKFIIETLSGATEAEDLDNIELRDLAGGTYDFTSSFQDNDWTLYLDDEIYLPMGETKTFYVEADVEDTMPNDSELRVYLSNDAMTITGDVSDATLSTTPSSVTGQKVTITDASLGWATEELTNKSVVEGAQDVLIYVASLEAGDSSLIDLRSFTLTDNGGAANAFDDDNIATLRAYLNGELLETRSGNIAGDGNASSSITFNSLDSTARKIPAGETYTLEVYADVENTVTTGSFDLTVVNGDISAKDVDSNTVDNVTSNYGESSRTVTLVEAGDLKVELLTNDAKADDDVYLLAGTETLADRYLGEVKFTTENEDVEVTKLYLAQEGTAAKDDILYVILYDEEGNEVASEAPEIDGDVEFEFDSGEMVFEADKTTSLFIGIEAKKIDTSSNQGTADFNETVQFSMDDVEAYGNESGDEITMTQEAAGDTPVMGEFSGATTTSQTAAISGAVITSVTAVTLSDTSFGGEQIIGKYKFVFDNDSNMKDNDTLEAALITLNLTISSSTGVTVSNVRAYIDGKSSNETDVVGQSGGVYALDFTSLDSEGNLLDGENTVIVKATVNGTATSDEWLQTKINDVETDIVWNGDNVADGSGTDYTGVRLDIDDPVGTKLSE